MLGGMHCNFCYTKPIFYSYHCNLYVICIVIPQCKGQGILINVYSIFSNTRVGKHRTGYSFTSQLITMRYRTFLTLYFHSDRFRLHHQRNAGADPEGGFGGFEPPPWSSKSFTSTVKLPSPNVSHSGGAL